MVELTDSAREAALSDAMDRYATGDSAAFEQVYDALAPRLRAMFRRRGCDIALCEDLLQQTLLHLHSARAHYRRGQQVAPWAFAIGRRLLIDRWRRREREARHAWRGEAAAPISGPEDELIADETARLLAHGLEAMPPRHREAFSLVKIDGLSLQQTAQVLGTTVTAIKLRVYRAHQTLRGMARQWNE
jgi:RNA polymerase sigma-70 factor (ECF subfamily)